MDVQTADARRIGELKTITNFYDMKLSNLKIATVSAMVIAVLSLNLVNPFSSQSYGDVKGMATEIPFSATANKGDLTKAWTPTTTLVSIVLYAATRSLISVSTPNTGLLDGNSQVGESTVILSKLD